MHMCSISVCEFYRNVDTLQERYKRIPHIILTCVVNFPAFSFAQYSQKSQRKDEKFGAATEAGGTHISNLFALSTRHM